MKYANLQLGRGLAACWVVCHHITGKLEAAFPGASLFWGGSLDLGWVGVDFFFVLSGFIIAMTLSKGPSVRDFVSRRFARIYPPFWVIFACTLLAALALPSGRAALSAFSPAEWLLSLALLPTGQSAPVIGVAWTLHHEILFYLVAALWTIRPALSAMVATVLLAGSLLSNGSTFPSTFFFSPLHWEFLFGVLAFLAHSKINTRMAWAIGALSLIWIAGFQQWLPAPNQADNALRVVQYGFGFGLLCLSVSAIEYAGRSPKPSRWRVQINQAMCTLGDWSFALYLLHIAIILSIVRPLQSRVEPNFMAIQAMGMLALVLCLLAARWFFNQVEQTLVTHCTKALAKRA